MLKNILYISASIVIFFVGLILYGLILNSGELSLEEALRAKNLTSIENLRLIVDRSNYRLQIYSGNTFVKSYKSVFGKNASNLKSSANDLVTPLGDYKICSIDTNHKYHKFLQLSYPNEKDAAESLKRSYISQGEFEAIHIAFKKNECPPKETKLGSYIGIHGIGAYDFIFRNLPFTFNWTNGSIAISNKNIDELASIVKIGTPVKITY
ncbi:MAG: L,D-transpeptidase [Melioribacteraceae bacterium]|nr:L,D-transpeptidase [Melioribacteraceae bacterium]